jgi:hypothetical protein
MNKKNLKILTALSLSILNARAINDEFRTPVPLDRGYAFSHYPFMRPDYDDCKCWYLDVWGAGLHKTANFAFTNKDSTKKESLAGIFFGAPSFTISQAFAPGTVSPLNPLLFLAHVTPVFDYRENTAFFGANIETVFGCENEWHVGLRTRVPFRDIRVGLDSCCNLADITSVNELARQQNELDIDPDNDTCQVKNAFAYRMDLVALLHKNQNTLATPDLLMQFADPDHGNNITIAGVELGKGPDGGGVNDHPVHVIERVNGTAPLFPEVPFFGLRSTSNVASVGSVNGGADGPLPFLAADGSGLANNQRARFADATPLPGAPNFYLPLSANSANQSRLWIVPTLDGTCPNLNMSANAQTTIQTAINNALLAIDGNNVDTFLAEQGINFDTKRINGIGNFDTELYMRYDGCLCSCGSWFAEGIFGVRFPTDTRVTSTSNLLLVPVGNNRHYEIKIGGYVGWNPVEWFAIKADAWYYWALRRKHTVSAPFTGATIANIGPGVDANVSWQYFIGDVDLTFMIPCIDPYVGFNVGYQAWVKRKTHVRLATAATADFFGITNPLNDTLLENRTKRIAHTIKAEIFKQTCDWQIYAGWNHAVAGKNALNDTDWYLGLEVYF